jgi:hypothetical protein
MWQPDFGIPVSTDPHKSFKPMLPMEDRLHVDEEQFQWEWK